MRVIIVATLISLLGTACGHPGHFGHRHGDLERTYTVERSYDGDDDMVDPSLVVGGGIGRRSLSGGLKLWSDLWRPAHLTRNLLFGGVDGVLKLAGRTVSGAIDITRSVGHAVNTKADVLAETVNPGYVSPFREFVPLSKSPSVVFSPTIIAPRRNSLDSLDPDESDVDVIEERFPLRRSRTIYEE